MDIKYKRVLIINDDDTEEAFLGKYQKLEKYRNVICYCSQPQVAFELITTENFGGFDKIILDIKIDWTIPDEYKKKITEFIDIDAMNQVNMGFILFMYLISRGYSIKRIAFLSAYIKEKDDEYTEKLELIKKISKYKKRNREQDEWIIKYVDKIPSLKNRIIRIIDSDRYKGVKAYNEIRRILNDDTASIEKSVLLDNGAEIENNEQFFQLLEKTGLKVEQKINKRDAAILEKWIISENTEELKEFYEFRCEVLNICESMKKLEPDIYKLYKAQKDFKKNYPPKYFEELMSKLQYEFFIFGEDKNIEIVVGNIINNIIAFWESLDKKYIDEAAAEEEISNHAITMVLKHTRNWYAHGRIESLDIGFCKFIFYLSIRLIYGRNKELDDYIETIYTLDDFEIFHNEDVYTKIWKEINEKVVVSKTLRMNTYTLNLVDLYYKYSNDKARKEIKLEIYDLFKMFILCLHFPFISNLKDDKYEIQFNKINYEKQEKYIIFLEKMAIKRLDDITKVKY